jgi:hypothetical protein
MIRTALLLVVVVLPVCAAPRPFRRAAKPRVLTHSRLVGSWQATWAGVRCVITLAANGDYRCDWRGLRYVGTWKLDRQGRVWITESPRPAEARSWQSYAVRLAPDQLAGPFEVGADGVILHLERPCAAPREQRPDVIDPPYAAY